MTRRKAAAEGPPDVEPEAAPALETAPDPQAENQAEQPAEQPAEQQAEKPAEKPAQKPRRRRPRRAPPPVSTEVDRVQVSDGALATVIGLAAHEVPGVVGMAPASLSEGLRRILGVSQVDEGVEVEHVAGAAEGAVTNVVLHVVVAYGVNIPAVAESVVERVRYAAATFAGVDLTDVKVHVAGVSRG
jgi:uncharacterized alkaline shock family protein YloU